jgi:hypothetical protein
MKLSSRFRQAGSVLDVVVPVGAQYQKARGILVSRHVYEQVEPGRVSPLEVVEDEQDRTCCRDGCEERPDSLE